MAKVAAERQFAPDPSKLTRVQTRIPKVGGLPSRSASADATSDLGKAVGKFGNTLAGIGAINQARDEDREVQAKKTAYQQFIRDHRFGNEQKGIIGLKQRLGEDGVKARAEFDDLIRKEGIRISGTSVSHRVNRKLPAAIAELQNSAFNISANHEGEERVRAERLTDLAEGVELGQAFADDPSDSVVLGQIGLLALKEQDRLGVPKDTKEGKLIRKVAVQKATSAAITLAIDNMLQGNDPAALANADALFNRADMQVRLTVEAKIAINNKLEKKARENVALLTMANTDVLKVLATGNIPPSESMNALKTGIAAAIKSPTAQKMAIGLAEAEKHNAIIRNEHRARSLVQQDANISTLVQKGATGTITGEETRLLEKLQKITLHNRSEITKGNGIALAAEYGLIDPVETLKLTDPLSYKNRAVQAGLASQAFGVAIQPLTAAEIKTINNMIMGKSQPNQLRAENEPTSGSTSPENVVATLTAMAQGLGRETAESMAGKALQSDSTAAMVMAIVPTRPGLAADMITGLRIMQSDPKAFPITAKNRNTEAEVVLGAAFSGATGAVRDVVLDAAGALYVFEQSKTGSSDFDAALYQQSIQRITGGMLTSGDNKVMAPVSGMTQGQFDDIVNTLSPEAMLEFSLSGGAPVMADGEPFDPKLLDKPFLSSGTDAEFRSIGFGKYIIVNPGSGLVLDGATGEAYQLDLRAYHESGQPATVIEARPDVAERQETLTGIAALRQRAKDQIKQEPLTIDIPAPPEKAGALSDLGKKVSNVVSKLNPVSSAAAAEVIPKQSTSTPRASAAEKAQTIIKENKNKSFEKITPLNFTPEQQKAVGEVVTRTLAHGEGNSRADGGEVPTQGSGVTYGRGVDLKHVTVAQLKAAGATKDEIENFLPYLGKDKTALSKAKLPATRFDTSRPEMSKTLSDNLAFMLIQTHKEEIAPFAENLSKTAEEVLISLRHWAGALGNTASNQEANKLVVTKDGKRTNPVWDALKGKTATNEDLLQALKETLAAHTVGWKKQRMRVEIEKLKKSMSSGK